MKRLLRLRTPLGPLTIEEEHEAIAAIGFHDGPGGGETTLLRLAARQIEEYFARRRHSFDLPLAPAATPFQSRLRAAMCAIPFGETRSYAELARVVGSAPRAVGQGCGRNPLPLLVPCHRVIAASGRLGGFSAGDGVATKQRLLQHESAAGMLDL
jgi:methylated-DNA-[protein]-cysteine S-methyltransferase